MDAYVKNQEETDSSFKQKRKSENRARIEHWKLVCIFLYAYDIVAVNVSYFIALWMRFDFRYSTIPAECINAFLHFAPWYTVFSILVFQGLRLYRSIWRFASFSELLRISLSSVITTIFQTVGITVFLCKMPISYYLIGAMLQFCMLVLIRFSYRFVLLERSRREQKVSEADHPMHHVMIIGAGAAGQIILEDLLRSTKGNAKPYCIIDDNPNKWNRYMAGIPIVGGRDEIIPAVEKYKIDQILFAIPSATAKQKKVILNICKETGCDLKTLPGMYQFVNGEVSVGRMKEVSVEDLLGREPIRVNMEEIYTAIQDKVILVTGGGGSIGSELCRQIAGHDPKQLIIFDIYENNAYDIEQELRTKYPNLNLTVLIGSVRDEERVNLIFRQYQPEIVYHAAAHKHVPLMEHSPCEAIKNNVFGTYHVAYAAMMYGCERFVLISTDKAVNPTNIMGASKRLCEMVVQSMNVISKTGRMDFLPFGHGKKIHRIQRAEKKPTEFVAVRFGNVLGSNGSVIPLFRKQINAGGPVTVTHPDITRYFMTIPEAVSLVLQAGTYAKGGEIFVLDMGEPVKIDTLARNLIKLSGFRPDEDIRIVYTGLRPGEKLYEEKLMAEEGMLKTPNDLIHIGKPIEMDIGEFFKQLEELAAYCEENSFWIATVISRIVTTYHVSKELTVEGEGEIVEYPAQRSESKTLA
jgi:FlaA1/EpsC-like NDP-sugar epimerase